jgi:deoxyadenosine/deoxycytidine kinase
MPIITISGQIGAGKSTLANPFLSERKALTEKKIIIPKIFSFFGKTYTFLSFSKRKKGGE